MTIVGTVWKHPEAVVACHEICPISSICDKLSQRFHCASRDAVCRIQGQGVHLSGLLRVYETGCVSMRLSACMTVALFFDVLHWSKVNCDRHHNFWHSVKYSADIDDMHYVSNSATVT